MAARVRGLTLTDGMLAELGRRLLPATALVRRLTADGGPVDACIEFEPRMAAGREPPRSERRGNALVCSRGPLALALLSTPFLPLKPWRPFTIRVEPGHPVTMALSAAHREPLVITEPPAADAARPRFTCLPLFCDDRAGAGWLTSTTGPG